MLAKKVGDSMKRVRISSHLTRYSWIFAALLTLTQVPSATNLPLVLDLTAGGSTAEPLSNAVAGWEFHINTPLTIEAVGLWDEGDSPLGIAHGVGLWMSDGISIFVATVDNNSMPVRSAPPGGQWPLGFITPATLQPGDYVLAAVWGGYDGGAEPFR
jgi:hypothetical protein